MKSFLYFLCEEDGRSLTVKNGVVSSAAFPTPLPFTPDGWQDISIGWERDMKTVGIVRNFTLSLGFVRDGAQILRKVVYDQGIERKLYLIITRRYTEVDLTGQTFAHTYRKYYKGALDLSTFQDSLTKVTCAISEGGVKKLYDAYRGTAFEYPLSEGDAIIKMDGIRLTSQKRYLCAPVSDYTSECQAPFNLDDTSVYAVAFSKYSEEGTPVNIAAVDSSYALLDDDTYLDSEAYFLLTTGTAEVSAQLSFAAAWQQNFAVTGGHCIIELVKNTGEVVATICNFDLNSGNEKRSIAFNETVNFTMNAGEKLFLVARLRTTTSIGFSGIPAKASLAFLETECSFLLKSRYRTTYIKAYTPWALFKRLVKSITGSELNAKSDLLQQYEDYVITSGDGLRVLQGAKIKTSLNDFIESFHTIAVAGIGVEGGKVTVEEKPYFLNNSNPVDLGEVKDLEVEPAKELLFNTVKIGYSPINTDDVNGKFAFNNTHIYKTAVTNVTKELALISPYAADPFAIEITRANLDGKTSTDNSSDNQVFFLNVRKQTATYTASFGEGFGAYVITLNDVTDLQQFPVGSVITFSGTQFNNKAFTIRSAGITDTNVAFLFVDEATTPETGVTTTATYGVRILNRPAMTITGVPDPGTIFNVLLSPKRLLQKHLPWINSVLWDMVGSKLTFQTTEKNADLVADGIVEKGDVVVGTERLFKNMLFSFDAPVRNDLAELLETEPNRSFSFRWQGLSFTGYTSQVGIAPNDGKEQKIKLLSTNDNNLSTLVR